jgi:uncharacterized protein YgiM (DUF1202 family)
VIGTVKVDDYLRIRAKAGTGNKVVGYLKNGDQVEILETKMVGKVEWGRISKGWMSLEYVVLQQTGDNSGSSSNNSNGSNDSNTNGSDPGTPETITTAKVTANSLYIRKGPGTSYRTAGYLKRNTKVQILEIKTVGGVKWGRTSKGWICLYYTTLTTTTVTPDSTEGSDSQPSGGNTNVGTAFTEYEGKVDATSLWIRKGAGTSYGRAGYYKNGATVTILEEKTVSGVKWGRTSRGWVCLTYVDKI